MTRTTTRQSMQAARFYAPGDVRFEHCPMPQPAAEELVIQIEAATTCGTDLKTYRRGHPVLLKNFPSPFGHEGAGIVHAVGAGVTQFKMGDRVVAANSAPCYQCFYCQKQQYNLCEHLDLLNGTYAEYLRIPAQIAAHNTYIIPPHVPFEIAALTEPLAVSLRGFQACRIQPGDSVAIIGLGAIGQFLAKLATLHGAHVVALGRNALKRQLAHTFAGADTVLDMRDESLTADHLRTHYTPHGHGFDVVIEAVGQPHTWELAIELVRKGGLVNLFGGCPRGSSITLDTRRMHYDELTLISLFHHTPQYVQQALALLGTNEFDATPLLTDRMPMASVIEALERVGRGEAMKIALFNPNHAVR